MRLLKNNPVKLLKEPLPPVKNAKSSILNKLKIDFFGFEDMHLINM